MRAMAALAALQPPPLPDFLMRGGPFGLLWWQWCALLIVLFAGWLIGVVLGRITIRLLTRLTARTASRWDDLLVAKKRGPVILLWAAAAWWLLLPAIELSPRATGTIGTLLRLTLYVALLWAVARAAD